MSGMVSCSECCPTRPMPLRLVSRDVRDNYHFYMFVTIVRWRNMLISSIIFMDAFSSWSNPCPQILHVLCCICRYMQCTVQKSQTRSLYVTQHRMHYAILITVRHIVNLALASLLPKKETIIPLSLECQTSLSSHTPHRSSNNKQHRSRKSAASHSTRRSISLGYISRRRLTQIPRSHICEFSLLRQ